MGQTKHNHWCLLQTLPKNSNNIFLENLKTTLRSLRNNNNIYLVAGGFNFDILRYENNPVINEFLNYMTCTLIFFSHILKPTRGILNSRQSLIDNLYKKPI